LCLEPRCGNHDDEQVLAAMSTLTVWHDGGRPLCQREIAFMTRLDRSSRIDLVDAARAEQASGPIDRADLLLRFHAREDSELLPRAAAFAAMWRTIPALRPFGVLARNRMARAALARIYRIFLRARPRLQRLVSRLAAA
jgi:predicted DCC family thiol-disulfide oxidoreductase YuxK